MLRISSSAGLLKPSLPDQAAGHLLICPRWAGASAFTADASTCMRFSAISEAACCSQVVSQVHLPSSDLSLVYLGARWVGH